MSVARCTAVAMLLLMNGAGVMADTQGSDDVQWRAVSPVAVSPHAGDAVNIHIEADIPSGWHVYAFHQPPGGPNALSITILENSNGRSAGEVIGPAPLKRHDSSFDLVTETYSGTVELQLPLKVNADLAPGTYQVPVKIRFQSCSDRECRPPRTVQLGVDLNVDPRNQP